MSNRDPHLQRALDNNDFITIGQKTSVSSPTKSFHKAYALFSLKTNETGFLPNDPIGIEFEKNLSPDVFICSYFILEQIHSLIFLSKESRYKLESLWSDFQTGQIHRYQTRVTSFIHPKKTKTSKKIKTPKITYTPLKKIQDVIDAFAYLLRFAPDDSQSWTSLDTIRSYFASPEDQRQIRQQWAKNVSLPAPTAQFFMVGNILLEILTAFLSEVKENPEVANVDWEKIKVEFRAGNLKNTRKKIQPFVTNRAIDSEDPKVDSSPSNDLFLTTVFNVLYYLLP